jgi:hypothetical protein
VSTMDPSAAELAAAGRLGEELRDAVLERAKGHERRERCAVSGVDIAFDVDGVFNAFPPVKHRSARLALNWGWPCEPTKVDVIGFPITFSPLLVERVHALVERPDVDAYWLTTWCDQAPADLCPAIGLSGKDWPVLGVNHRDTLERGWWKHAAIRDHLEATDRRVVWIDDDLADERAAQRWVSAVNAATPGRILGIAPETHNGLTLDHLDLIERWIETGENAADPTLQAPRLPDESE